MPNPIKLTAEITDIHRFGDSMFLVQMYPKGRIPRFKAGQFLHLTVEEFDPSGGYWPESRVFSIASSPDKTYIEIVYSVKGRYTKRMSEELRIGKNVWIKLPYGDFTIDGAVGVGQDVVLVAGGTGVSPFLPYLEKILAEMKRDRVVRLYYGARVNDMLFALELVGRCAESGLVEATILIENEDPDTRIPIGARAERGRLDIDRIRAECKGLADPVYFLSGPPAMIKAFKDGLGAAGVAAANIKIDEWE